MNEVLSLLVIGVIIYYFVNRHRKKKYRNNYNSTNNYYRNPYNKNFFHKNADIYQPSSTIIIEEPINEQNYNKENYDIKTAYKKRKFLTENEKRYYSFLKGYAEKKNLQILSKIRLADLIEVDETYSTREIDKKVSFSKISSKHIDFALCAKFDLEPIILIEVDDMSHFKANRAKRDMFVDNSLLKAGYKILHTYSIEELERKLNYFFLNEYSTINSSPEW